MNASIIARRGAFVVAIGVAAGACWPDVHEEAQGKVDSGAAGGTLNRDNTTAGVNRDIAPPGQGSALSDTAAGRLPSAGVSGPTQGLSGAAPAPRNSNAQTRAQTGDTAGRGAPRAPSAAAPRTP